MTSEELAGLRGKQYNATAVGLRRAHSDLMALRVRPDYPIPPHKPGQYCTLGLGQWESRVPECQPEVLKPGDDSKLVRRAYSIGSPVLNEQGELWDQVKSGWLEFYIVLVRESAKGPPALTPRLFTLNEGDRLFMG